MENILYWLFVWFCDDKYFGQQAQELMDEMLKELE